MAGCGKDIEYPDIKCGDIFAGKPYLCDKCRDANYTSDENQPKYASALSGGNAENDDSSLDSRDASKKVDNNQEVNREVAEVKE